MNLISDKKIILAASVSCFDMMNLKRHLTRAERAGVNLLHYDVVDGRFNNCFILGLPTLTSMKNHIHLPLEVHLGVYEPEKYIEQFAEAGADYIAVHYEVKKSIRDIEKLFTMIIACGAKPLLALRAETDLNEDAVVLLQQVEWVIKLTVNPGYSGQKMQHKAIEKLQNIHDIIVNNNLNTRIEADGNINPETIPYVVQAGADILTGGSSGLITGSRSIARNAKKMISTAIMSLEQRKKIIENIY